MGLVHSLTGDRCEVFQEKLPGPPSVRSGHEDIWSVRLARLRDGPDSEEKLGRGTSASTSPGRRSGILIRRRTLVSEQA
jgi:hypothetical protein